METNWRITPVNKSILLYWLTPNNSSNKQPIHTSTKQYPKKPTISRATAKTFQQLTVRLKENTVLYRQKTEAANGGVL